MIASQGISAAHAALIQRIERTAAQCNTHLDAVELFRLDVEVPRHFSHAIWRSRQHVIVSLSAGGQVGWAERIGGHNQPGLDLAAELDLYRPLAGLSLSEAFDFVRHRLGDRHWSVAESAELAVLDLIGRCAGVSLLSLLGLEGSDAVPTVACVLQRDPHAAGDQARAFVRAGQRSHMKCKLFGDKDVDATLVTTIRNIIGADAYLIGDVNCGYVLDVADPKGVDALGDALRQLHARGLSACEDPADLAPQQWVRLQSAVGPLDLIADVPLRPARVAIGILQSGIARICNLHPSCMGSIVDAVALAGRVRQIGARVMIGDDSLIGPGCAAWQQLAIGLNAAWVEAIEKPDESCAFTDCLTATPLEHRQDGHVLLGINGPPRGLGIEVDVAKLRASAVPTARAQNSVQKMRRIYAHVVAQCSPSAG